MTCFALPKLRVEDACVLGGAAACARAQPRRQAGDRAELRLPLEGALFERRAHPTPARTAPSSSCSSCSRQRTRRTAARGPVIKCAAYGVAQGRGCGFSSLMKQNKKAKIYFVICFAGKKKLLFYIYAVIVKQKIYKRSSNYYCALCQEA